MAERDHWQPVLRSSELGADPVAVTVAGEQLVLFRDASGRAVALDDVCPHRGMRLSLGRVEQGNIVCPYHGWAFRGDGTAVVPPARNPHACASRWDCIERHRLVFVKPPEVTAPFPRLEVDGFHHVVTFRREIDAPVQLVLDNFIEVEHTPDTHAFLGYDNVDDVRTTVEADDDSVYVHNVGPQKRVPKILRPLANVSTGDEFTDEWTTYFSPVHTVYDHIWRAPGGGELKEHLRSPVFFVPIDEHRTNLFVSIYARRAPLGRFGLNLLSFAAVGLLSRYEVELDAHMVEAIADKSTSLKGRKLSRFDTALGRARERMARIYRGEGMHQDR